MKLTPSTTSEIEPPTTNVNRIRKKQKSVKYGKTISTVNRQERGTKTRKEYINKDHEVDSTKQSDGEQPDCKVHTTETNITTKKTDHTK